MKYFDISPLLSPSTPVFPGDQVFERAITMAIAKGDNIGLSWIKSTVHIGAHTDAPSHYHKDGETIEQRDLSFYIGKCQVIDVTHVGARRILPSDIEATPITAERILFKSNSFAHDQSFQMEFTSLSPELIDQLAAKKVRLVGIDSPSVDPADSKDLPSHAALYHHNLAVLEGIDLGAVPPGRYQLVALPLRIEGADASPVRAVLFPF
ncbi:MAG: cyclase family protein [Chitinophagaceae bacterium]|nr:cyclase family protein [Oligoflexus sp.]